MDYVLDSQTFFLSRSYHIYSKNTTKTPMNFNIVFCKNRKKIDKYIKINKIRNKVIVDIKQQLEENGINKKNMDSYKDYFNLLIYTRIMHSLSKGKDIYYIPNFTDNINLEDLLNIRELLDEDVNFNAFFIYEDFLDSPKLQCDILDVLHNFDTRQIIKDY